MILMRGDFFKIVYKNFGRITQALIIEYIILTKILILFIDYCHWILLVKSISYLSKFK